MESSTTTNTTSIANSLNCSLVVTHPTLSHPSCVVDNIMDEIVVAILIILLVIYTFYRLLHVWAYTLNFSEVNTRLTLQ